MRGINHIHKITPEKVQQIKNLLSRGLSQRNVARRAEVSQYTVWHVNHGTYDTDMQLAMVHQRTFNYNKCPITGMSV